MIHYERNSPWPFTTQQGPPETPVSAYELIKLELDYWTIHAKAENDLPSNEELQFESCCIILGSEILSRQPDEPGPSWLRDLLMSSQDMVKLARVRPTTTSLRTRITQLAIHGKRDIFEHCAAEAQLQKFVSSAVAQGSVITDAELQSEASRIVSSMEMSSSKPWSMFTRFLNDLIFGSSQWLLPFRVRANLMSGDSLWNTANVSQTADSDTSANGSHQITSELPQMICKQVNDGHNVAPVSSNAAAYFQDDSNCYRRLTRELSRYVSSTLSPRNPTRHKPTDEELQHQARWIMFDE